MVKSTVEIETNLTLVGFRPSTSPQEEDWEGMSCCGSEFNRNRLIKLNFRV